MSHYANFPMIKFWRQLDRLPYKLKPGHEGMAYLLVYVDKLHVGLLVRQKEDECGSFISDTSGPSAPVHKSGCIRRRVELDNPVNVSNVYPTGHNVGAHQKPASFQIAELVKNCKARLLQLSVNAHDGNVRQKTKSANDNLKTDLN